MLNFFTTLTFSISSKSKFNVWTNRVISQACMGLSWVRVGLVRGPGKEIPAVKDKSPKKMRTFIWSLQAPSEAKTKATLGLAEDVARKLK